MNIARKIFDRLDVRGVHHRLDKIEQALGRIETRQLEILNKQKVEDWEFQVTSQWGEDGIIQALIKRVPIENKIFVEFGVETYTEANTRFLLQNNNWAGLVMDGSKTNIDQIKKESLYWRFNLKAQEAFITRENINALIRQNGIQGDIGILSVDIDGNDYWVWEAIDVVKPRIVICEYNSIFGPVARVTTPYDPSFVRGSNGRPNNYYGASISALNFLAEKKGYRLVAGNRAGNNIFFVKNEFAGGFAATTPEQAYVKAQFKESRNLDGSLSFLDFEGAQKTIQDLPVVEVEKNQEVTLRDFTV